MKGNGESLKPVLAKKIRGEKGQSRPGPMSFWDTRRRHPDIHIYIPTA
jgi:hypothetical protein